MSKNAQTLLLLLAALILAAGVIARYFFAPNPQHGAHEINPQGQGQPAPQQQREFAPNAPNQPVAPIRPGEPGRPANP